MNTSQLEKGVIKTFNNNRGKGGGYGFISRPGGEADLFCHASQIRGASDTDRQLFPGDEVSFQIGRDKQGRPVAENVRVQIRASEPPVRARHD